MIHRLFSYALAAFAGLVIVPAAAQAHPHIWVTVKSEVVYGPDGTVTGVRHAWTFDDMFSVFATQGIESKKKGEFTREELAPLAEVNVTSLKEYDFFTYAKANGKKVEFNEPLADYYLDFNPKDTVLTLYFTLPLKAPVKAKDLTLEVYDREREAAQIRTAEHLARTHVLFFVFRSDCPYCQQFAPLLKSFEQKFGLPAKRTRFAAWKYKKPEPV